MQYILPSPSIITEQGKVAGIISIFSQGICGEDNFGCPRLKEGKLWAGKAGGDEVKKSRYAPDINGLLVR